MRPPHSVQNEQDLFRMRLENMIDQGHELVRLSRLINWDRIDEKLGAYYHESKGRCGLRTRLMAGLHLLKHMKGLSDESICESWLENPYYQAFCGEAFFQHTLPFDRSSLTRWRQRMGSEALEVLLSESLVVACKSGALRAVQMERVTVDTTVQTKAIAHPTDTHLLLRSMEWLVRLARRHGVALRQSFSRLAPRACKEAARLFHNGKVKAGKRWVKKLRTWLGRLIRDIERKISGDGALEAAFSDVLASARRIWQQQPGDKKKLYAFHASEVECIGKGKTRTRYEFGVKTSVATTNARAEGGQFIVGALTLPGNPYDGHSLAGQIEQIERIIGRSVKRVYVDRGYRGHGLDREDMEVLISYTRNIVSPTMKRELRRRNAIEPVIGHCKSDGLLERNHLKGEEGDAINAILVAAGHNFRLLARWLRFLFVFFYIWIKNRTLRHKNILFILLKKNTLFSHV